MVSCCLRASDIVASNDAVPHAVLASWQHPVASIFYVN
jgi:hypothetical protein